MWLYLSVFSLLIKVSGISLVVQWLGLCAPGTGGPGSIPEQGSGSHMLPLGVYMPQLKILHVTNKNRPCVLQLRPGITKLKKKKKDISDTGLRALLSAVWPRLILIYIHKSCNFQPGCVHRYQGWELLCLSGDAVLPVTSLHPRFILLCSLCCVSTLRTRSEWAVLMVCLQDLKLVGINLPKYAAELAENRGKNRYNNVLPCKLCFPHLPFFTPSWTSRLWEQGAEESGY